MTTSSKSMQRSWTANDEPGTSKWLPITLLSIALAVCLYYFLAYAFGKPEPNTFALSVTVTRYSDQVQLPQPAFDQWDMEELVGSFASRGLLPWVSLEPRYLELKSKFDTEAIQKELVQNKLKTIDTLIVYLRGHAIAINGEAYLLTGDFARTEILTAGPLEKLDRAEKLSEMFARLQQLPVGNVIVLADVCDLQSVPQLGVMANNVPELIGGSLGNLASTKPLWVVTPSASLQPSHVSEVRRRTLLQSASEYALDARRATKQDKLNRFLSLAKFYEAILRYSHDVTDKSQTPLLFRSGSPKHLDTDHLAWQEAAEVRVARRSSERLPDLDANDGSASPENEKTAANEKTADNRVAAKKVADNRVADNRAADNRAADNKVRLISLTQQPPATTQVDSDNTSQTNQGQTNASQPNETDPANSQPPKLTEETQPRMRFWQVRDRLLNRANNSQGWSPADFAAMSWRQIELTAASLDRGIRLAGSNTGDETRRMTEDITRSVKLLEELSELMRTPRPSSGTEHAILTAWNALQREVDIKQSPKSGRHPWANPQALPSEIAQQWLPIRQSYRDYIDALSQTPSWFAYAATHDEVVPSLERLVDALIGVDSLLPKTTSQSAIDRPVTPNDLSALARSLSNLEAEFDGQFRAVLLSLDNAVQQGGKAISWADERRVQELLNGTCLSYEDRKRLLAAYTRLKANNVREPGAGNHTVLNIKLELNSLLEDLGTDDALVQRGRWCSVLRRALELTNPPEISNVPSSSEQLNAWGRELLTSMIVGGKGGGDVEDAPARKFALACLFEFRPQSTLTELGVGLIVPVSNDTSLNVVMPNKLQLPRQLAFDVRLRNASPVESCFIKWQVTNADAYSYQGEQLLRITSSRLEKLQPDLFQPIAISGGQIVLELSTDLNSLETKEAIELAIAVSTDSSGADASVHQIEISPPNPNRVELYATSLNPLPGAPNVTRSEIVPMDDDNFSILSGLSVPAVSHLAKSSYEFHLVNLSDEAKVVRAALYAVEPGSGQLIGNGRITKKALQYTQRRLRDEELQPLFVSGPIQLPSNQLGIVPYDPNRIPSTGQKINFEPYVPAGEASGGAESQGGLRNAGEFGLLCVLEEVAIDGENQVRKLRDKPETLHWIDCVCANPGQRLVLAKLLPQADSFILRVEVPRENWRLWDLKELKLNIQLTDTQGTAIPFSGPNMSLLNEETSNVDLMIAPTERNNRPYVVHVDIGGYPRAVNFQSRLGALPDDARGTNQAFVWLDPNNLICTDIAGKPLATGRLISNAVVIPARENSSGESDGTAVSIANIEIPVPMDFESGSRAKIEIESNTRIYDWDRKAVPRFTLKGGSLVFTAAVEDLTHEIPVREFRFSGRNRLEVSVINEPQSTRSFDLFFDQQPPEVSNVELSGAELYLDESIEVSIAVSDDSNVEKVFFAVDKENVGADKYDVGDMLRLEARADGGRWIATLDAEKIANAPAAEKLLPNRRYFLVCRSIDSAGNIQDSHKKEPFLWTNQKRPVSVPKPKPKPKKAAAPPPEPTQRTVIVDITVEGKSPPYPKNTAVSGIAGAHEKNVGGSWMITEVADGPYEITATYADAFGVEFEGKGKLNVSPKASRVSIDVKRKK